MGPRQVGCFAALVIAAVLAFAIPAAIPTIPTPQNPEATTWFVRVFVGVLVFFGTFSLSGTLLSWLFPTRAELAAREADRAMRAQSVRAVAEAVEGTYLRVRGRIEAGASLLEGPISRRACVAYSVTRHRQRRRSDGAGRSPTKQRGARARLADASGSLALALEGVEYTATGDAFADSIVQAAAANIADLRAMPEIEYGKSGTAYLYSDGTPAREWPKDTPAPDAARLREIDERDFPGAGGRAAYEENVLAPGEEVEAVGFVVRDGDELVLTGPKNGSMRVTVTRAAR